MKNTLLNFDQEEVDDYIVSDYFSRKLILSDIITEEIKNAYFVMHRLEDNDKLERLSYDIYGTTDYWDLLALINYKDPLFGMSYDFENYTSYTDDFIDSYNDIYSNKPLSESRLAELKEEFYEINRIKNEQNRYIYIVLPSKLQEFLKLIKLAGFVW